MKTKEDAITLAHTMIELGKTYNVKVICVLSKMNEPLGYAIGNGLEVKETMDALKGNYSEDFLELITTLGSHMVSLGLDLPFEEAKQKLELSIHENKGYSVFEKMVESQKGNIQNIIISNQKVEVKSQKTGYIHEIDAYKLAHISLKLGAGRENLTDIIDPGVGIWLNKKTGDFVRENETLATIYFTDKMVDMNEVLDSFIIKEEEKKKESIILDVIY